MLLEYKVLSTLLYLKKSFAGRGTRTLTGSLEGYSASHYTMPAIRAKIIFLWLGYLSI